MSTRFILKPGKKNGNYSIHRKLNESNINERATYTIYGAHLKFGVEKYNNNHILNAILYETNNSTYNIIVTLERIVNTFTNMGKHEVYAKKYNLENKTFFSFIKNNTIDPQNKQFIIRLYLKRGCKIMNSNKEIIPSDQIKNKYCNIEIEVGSLWSANNLYGLNVYATEIKLN